MTLEIPDDVTLHPCPLCGSHPLLKTNATVNSQPQYWLKCENPECGFSHAAACYQQFAINRWNALSLEESMDKKNKMCRSRRRASAVDRHVRQVYDYAEQALESQVEEGKMERFFCPEDGKMHYRLRPQARDGNVEDER
jgi:predicted RNA-binding Zn-ribbon protein involved in translation (DUF1610 family)